MRTTRLMLATLSLAIPLAVMADPAAQNKKAPPRHEPTLMELVQNNIDPAFFNPANALARNWVNATACVSGPNEGAMGHHLIDPTPDPVTGLPLSFVDGVLDPGHPEAFIYEPVGNGFFRLVGVEFIQTAAEWDAKLKNHEVSTPTPRVNGQLMNLVGTPNRYGLPAFYELHVWAFADNPLGNFADFNTRVTCNRAQPADLTR